MHFSVNPSGLTGGTLRVPGDKSVSHRALLLAGVANGASRVTGFLPGEDCLATLTAMRAMGVRVDVDSATSLTVHGVGLRGLEAPVEALDLGNSGTAMRLMSGLVAGQDFGATLTGDASLSGRPMGRVIRPLETMGAVIASRDGRPPLEITGSRHLRGIDYAMPIASAQVKSAILIAGLYADGRTTVREPAVTRDHTERMLETMGISVTVEAGRIGLEGGAELTACDIEVPGDISSATFPLLAALLADDAELTIEGVGINPTRTGVIAILEAMGANIELTNRRDQGAEPVADIHVRSSALVGIDVDPALVSLAIDEFPALFVAAAAARGTTRFRGLEELRVKESDRIATMAEGLMGLGIAVEETPDGAKVTGGSFRGGEVDSHGDHRVAMALAVAATIATGPVRVTDVAPVATSFPGFTDLMLGLGADIRQEGAA